MKHKSAAENISDANRIGVDLLIEDARVAFTLLDLAESSSHPDDRSRRISEACKACTSILFFLRRLEPDAEQIETLRRDLANLERRLKAAGVPMSARAWEMLRVEL